MRRKVTAMEARRNLGELLEQVFYRGDEIVVERAGKPMAILVQVDRFERLDSAARERLKQLLDNAWKGPELSEEEAEALALEAVAWARGKTKPGRRKKSA